MVLDQGRLVEFDSPINLLNNEDGYLYNMVAATGSKTAEYLRKIAMGQLAVVDVLRESASKQEDEDSRSVQELLAQGAVEEDKRSVSSTVPNV